jgi:hypothetical protein
LVYESLSFFQQFYDQQIVFLKFRDEISRFLSDVMLVPNAQDAPDIKQAGPITWNYHKMDGAQSKRGCAKDATCAFCDSSFTGCSTSRALAHLLGRAVLGQKIANIGSYVPIREEDDNIQFKSVQKVLNKDMMAAEQQLSTLQRKQTVLDLTSPAKRRLTE